YQGIPYAAPPTGTRRWAPPAPAGPWQGTLDATQPRAACPQTGATPPAGRKSDTENCLFLNVTTPRKSSPTPRPVMVYLHGADHTDGEGAMNHAERLAVQGDVIVVTVNYRLGALGYLAHPALEKNGRGESGNYGFQDQQAALRWVQRNAAAFGGDKHNVTLFGESAGGYSTCAHLVAPSSAGLFHRAITQSAPCTEDVRTDRKRALAQGEKTTAAIEDDHDLEDWRKAAPTQLIHDFGTGPHYSPVYGGKLLPRSPQQAFASGRFNKVPVLQGINRNEQRAMVYGLEQAKKHQTKDPHATLDDADVRAHLEAVFGPKDARTIAARYRSSAYDDTPALALAAALTDAQYARPTADTARALSGQVPAYAYEFAESDNPWYADPNYPKPSFPAGAGHTFELPYLFELEDFQPLNDTQQRLSSTMIRIWSGFARTGRADWKPSTPGQLNAQALSSTGTTPVDFAKEHDYGFWKSLD
ncbi:carboxylesterase family protein, partial [Streptomyces sp. A7024]